MDEFQKELQAILENKRRHEKQVLEKYEGKIKTLDDLIHIRVLLYGSHQYNDFLFDFLEDIELLKPREVFELYKDLYTATDYAPDLAEEIQYISSFYNIQDDVDIIGTVKAYRGVNKYNSDDGYSYTLNREIAEWFANRYDSNGYIKEVEITKNDVIFYNNDRSEEEVFLKKSSLL